MQVQSDRLDNCTICGKLYLKTFTDHCLECYKEIEEDFKIVEAFLRREEHRFTTLEDLSEATEVSAKRISSFIREGRIYGEDFPNLGYPCAHCGIAIKRQILCTSCYDTFSMEINKTLKQEQLLEELAADRRQGSGAAKYWQLKQGK